VLVVDDDVRNIFALSSGLSVAGNERSNRRNRARTISIIGATPDLGIGPHGHYDAGDGWIRDDAGHPAKTPCSAVFPSSR